MRIRFSLLLIVFLFPAIMARGQREILLADYQFGADYRRTIWRLDQNPKIQLKDYYKPVKVGEHVQKYRVDSMMGDRPLVYDLYAYGTEKKLGAVVQHLVLQLSSRAVQEDTIRQIANKIILEFTGNAPSSEPTSDGLPVLRGQTVDNIVIIVSGKQIDDQLRISVEMTYKPLASRFQSGEDLIIARVPEHYKELTTINPLQPFSIKKKSSEGEYSVRFGLIDASYIVTEGVRTPERNNNKTPASDSVRFRWKVTLINLSDKDDSVYFYFRFFDTQDFRMRSVGGLCELAAGETKTFQQDSTVKLSTLLKADDIACTLTPDPEY